MNRNGYFRSVEPGDVAYLAPRLREADRLEIMASSGLTDIETILQNSIDQSLQVWVGCSPEGEPAGVLGVASVSLLGGIGCPWMLATDLLDRVPGRLMTNSRIYLERMHELFPHLENFVDARNVRSVRWLRRLGFHIHPAAPHGPAGHLFHRFERHV